VSPLNTIAIVSSAYADDNKDKSAMKANKDSEEFWEELHAFLPISPYY